MANSISGHIFRYFHILALISLCIFSMAACSEQSGNTSTQGKTMTEQKNDVVYMDVSMLSYYERPIFDVKLNGIDIGAAGAPPHGDHAGLVAGVPIHLGPQVITWRLDGPKGMAGNGDTITAKNKPIFTRPGPKFHYLGVHIYPDNTVEVIPEEFWPQNSEKGEAFLKAWEEKHGQ